MKENRLIFPIKKMAPVLKISRSRYYKWLKNPVSSRSVDDDMYKILIEQIFDNMKKRYGSPRIHSELRSMGYRLSKKRVARLMKEKGLEARPKRHFKTTTNSHHDNAVAPNLLMQDFTSSGPNKVWASDITYIRTQEGWLYLCVIIDLYSRKVVGWSFSKHIDTALVCASLRMALLQRSPMDGLIFHSDRGVQYTAKAFRKLTLRNNIQQSMSSKGNCYDNACVESFFAQLKLEEVYNTTYKARNDARVKIFEYIATFYNRIRRHSALDYVSPDEYELRSENQNAA